MKNILKKTIILVGLATMLSSGAYAFDFGFINPAHEQVAFLNQIKNFTKGIGLYPIANGIEAIQQA